MRFVIILWVSALLASMASAEDLTQREGWVVMPTPKPFDQLVDDVKAAVTANKMGVVTQAGPTEAAKARGITIPGNRVIGVFNNIYAVRILQLSTAAMIEAPIRMYVTENADGTATLSYKTPTLVFTPYMAAADPDLATVAQELDDIFESIAQAALQ
ncbi:DUF302 domain-containing protein [Actibacterium sp. 188UL27-1]|uniref:DUF302 domain-containing protein n=1 Tax=Actibacterium sp. 188UL27-1 TaxID=2786961 RepID=UPI00195A0372|nr:DUF302 domain-containing protein [Actibacterium sp. 188UL27-1]MBM7066807.1 DUF302 domain-containing protein [Actibacterium sp. 188UL27-1]